MAYPTGTPAATSFAWACPECRRSIVANPENAECPECETRYEVRGGIWDFLPPRREAIYTTFIEQYEIIRREEKWGNADGEYYRALPHVPPGDPNRGVWRLRRRTFRTFMRRILAPLEARSPDPLRILDLGAGNGWLANRLALRGHRVAAVDLRTGERDGLGAHVHYESVFTTVRAEFERLPFETAQFDLAIFNASLHYAEDYERTLREAVRVLGRKGKLVIVESPVYRRERAGRNMVYERERDFSARFGFASNALECEHYLTYDRLDDLAKIIGITWEFFRPHYGLRWRMRPLSARLLGRREPAEFLVISADKSTNAARPTGGLEDRTTSSAVRLWAGSLLGRRRRILPPAVAYDRWAPSYRRRMNPFQRLEEEALISLLPDLRGKDVLDLACGTGRVSSIAIERGAASTTGVDRSKAMLDRARSTSTASSTWIQADMASLPLKDELFDVVVCALALGHVEPIDDALSEMNRVMKSGAVVLISDFHPFAVLRGSDRTFQDPATGRTYAISQYVHLFEDYMRCFGMNGWTLDAVREPRYDGFPAVFILRARKEVPT